MQTMYYSGEPNRQFSPSLPLDDSPQYHAVDGTSNASIYGVFDDRPGYHGLSAASSEENVDMASRARLTQEQLGELETEFASNHKPNTEYKKSLADRMRVEYPKVNNWFQNRRAKAKQQNQPRSDPLNGDEPYPYPDSVHHSVEHGSLAEVCDPRIHLPSDQGTMLNVDFSAMDFPPNSGNDHQHHYTDQLGPLATHLGHLSRPIGEVPSHSMFQHAMTVSPSWPIPAPFENLTAKAPTTSIVELEPVQYAQESPSTLNYGLVSAHVSTYNSQPLYQSITGDHNLGNPSSHSFMTSPSEEDEHAKFITPPQESSPLPIKQEDLSQHDRRTSSSSELADNFDTIHLQQPQFKLGLHESPHRAPVSAPNVFSASGLPTPEISPDTTISNPPFPNDRDLASRRKRPRPAALQPDSNRSFSYAGPSTASPHLRVSPPGSARISPVRRIRSTGHSLNVMTGRVKKSGTASAQMSPRNLESYLKASSCADIQSTSGEGLQFATLNGGGTNDNFCSKSPPVTSTQQTQTTWDDPQAQHSSRVPPYVHIANRGMAGVYDQEPNLNWGPPLQIHANSLGPLSYEHISPPPFSFHCPPQSAPSHITTFSELPSSISADMQTGWAIPFSGPTPSYRDDTQLSMASRINHPHHHSHSGPFGHFPNTNPSLDIFPQIVGPLRSHTHPFSDTTSLDHKNIEFKIDTGPSPPKELAQAMHEPKEYQFNNQFSDTFPSSHGKK